MMEEEVLQMNVVLVEDSNTTRLYLESLFRSRDHKVVGSFGDADSAISSILEMIDEIDLMLIDIFLGGERNGIDVVESVSVQKPIPVIYLTASEDPQVAARARKTSPYGFLLKPFKELVFFSTIEIVESRIDAEKRFRRRIAFEQMISGIYRRLHEPGDPDFVAILNSLGTFVQADRVVLLKIFPREGIVRHMALWPPSEQGKSNIPSEELPSLLHLLPERRDQLLRLRSHEAQLIFFAPPLNYLAMPIFLPEGGAAGCIAFDREESRRPWSGADGRLLRMAAEMIGGWWHRKETEASLRHAQSSVISKEKLASIGMLSAGIIHEIANPLSFVESNVRTLGKSINQLRDETTSPGCEDFSKEGPELSEIIDETVQGLERIVGIVSSIRSFSAGGGDIGARKGWYELNEGIRSTLALIRTFAGESAEVVLELGEVPPIYCYGARINQVLLNLLTNAARAIREKENLKDGRILVKSGSADGYLFCTVSDNGNGIDPRLIDTIFEPFFTTREDESGSGLGLAIAREIIETDHGGRLTVESEGVGKGSSFTLTIPLRPEP
ncbi:hybrid sensor histidine kinase/response regulator [Sediminispirochaeta smaragdinae]|uniref:histidine kinase n=1 Tax=Sediminispirochaeta smaragdinae (strain DSM 11293 / JCM 15392 / SEBR 4228) TaxID=573413 RepID=E1R503_SEDSS|nr:ATP-binding protein [Sediminispirochaeta smaragdinae]ADK80538.1 multi-sensor signal transduction histidine kinase [Sediminispirochaeta smaragdinae DSM 11293]